MKKISILMTTFLRNGLMYRTVNSILKNMSEDNILLIADQGNQSIEKEKFYQSLDKDKVLQWYLPYDCGLSYARNFLVDKAKELQYPYCLLTADSIEFIEPISNLNIIIKFLESNKNYGIVGLKLNNRIKWEKMIRLDEKQSRFILKNATESMSFSGVSFTRCDITKNFFLAKTNALYHHKWDNNLKLCIQEDMPIITKNGWSQIKTIPIKNLFPPSVKKQNTYNFIKRKIKIFTPEGWKKIKKITKRKSNKKIYCITTNSDYIELTEDHPILTDKILGIWKEPKNLKIGDTLVNNILNLNLTNSLNVNLDWAWLLGFFLAEGTCKGKGDRIEFTNQDKILLQKCESILNKIGINCEWYSKSNRKDKCHFLRIKTPKLLINYFKEFYSYKEKIIPYFIYNFSKKSRLSFLNGFWKGDGTKKTGYNPCIVSQKSASIIQGLILLTKEFFKSYKIRTQENNFGMWYKLSLKTEFKEKNPNQITNIKIKKENNYVYDLEIDNPHFFVCGIGNLLVHNCEHEDFFWKLKLNSFLKVFYTDYYSANYINNKPFEYKKMRQRLYGEFIPLFLKKYNLKYWFKNEN